MKLEILHYYHNSGSSKEDWSCAVLSALQTHAENQPSTNGPIVERDEMGIRCRRFAGKQRDLSIAVPQSRNRT